MNSLSSSIRPAVTLLLVSTVLLGGVYPLMVYGFGQVFFPLKAEGSLIEKGGKVIGSSLLGQSFDEPKYFWGRLSATTPAYNAAASAGSNLSPANAKLLDAANTRIADLQKADPQNRAPIPVDLVTASASGLDPHISLAAAQYQVGRVSKARHMKPEEVDALITATMKNASFGFMGTPRVNVLRLNIALDEAVQK